MTRAHALTLAALALVGCGSAPSDAEPLCYGAVACASHDGAAPSAVAACVEAYRVDAGHPESFADCCAACAEQTNAARLACEAHCGGYQECCPR